MKKLYGVLIVLNDNPEEKHDPIKYTGVGSGKTREEIRDRLLSLLIKWIKREVIPYLDDGLSGEDIKLLLDDPEDMLPVYSDYRFFIEFTEEQI